MKDFDEIVFEKRHKKYGAYLMRKRYYFRLLIASILAFIVFFIFTVWTEFHIYKKSDIFSQIMDDSTGILVFSNFEVSELPAETARKNTSSSDKGNITEPTQLSQDATPELTEEMEEIEDKMEEEIQQQENNLADLISEELVGQAGAMQEESQSLSFPEYQSPIISKENFLRRYIIENTKYPHEAIKKKMNGLVLVQFMLSKKGEIKQVEILKNANPILDKEALRVVKSIPAGKPVIVNGKPIAVMFKFPIIFKG